MKHNLPRAIKLSEFTEMSKADETLLKVIRAIEKNDYSDKSIGMYKRYSKELSVYNSSLVLRGNRIVVPECLWSLIYELAHEGHQGIEKTKSLIRERVWFPGIDAMVEDMIKKCKACQLTSGGNHPTPIVSTQSSLLMGSRR